MNDIENMMNKVNIGNESSEAIIHKNVGQELSFYDTWMMMMEHVRNDKIILLKNPDVVSWLLGDFNFLHVPLSKTITQHMNVSKKAEDDWGIDLMKTKRPELHFITQWTTKFGEDLAYEIYTLLGETYKKPQKMEHFQPDGETDTNIIEVKTGTYFTSGTAHEKIIGCKDKYIAIPDLYSKPLKILCIGGMIQKCNTQIFEPRYNKQKEILKHYKDVYLIEYIKFTDLMNQYINSII